MQIQASLAAPAGTDSRPGPHVPARAVRSRRDLNRRAQLLVTGAVTADPSVATLVADEEAAAASAAAGPGAGGGTKAHLNMLRAMLADSDSAPRAATEGLLLAEATVRRVGGARGERGVGEGAAVSRRGGAAGLGGG